MYPNNPAAEINKLEAFDADGNLNPRHIEKVLREAGLSKKDAVTASSILKKIVTISEKVTPARDAEAVTNEAAILKALEERELLAVLSKRI